MLQYPERTASGADSCCESDPCAFTQASDAATCRSPARGSAAASCAATAASTDDLPDSCMVATAWALQQQSVGSELAHADAANRTLFHSRWLSQPHSVLLHCRDWTSDIVEAWCCVVDDIQRHWCAETSIAAFPQAAHVAQHRRLRRATSFPRPRRRRSSSHFTSSLTRSSTNSIAMSPAAQRSGSAAPSLTLHSVPCSLPAPLILSLLLAPSKSHSNTTRHHFGLKPVQLSSAHMIQ